MIIAQFGGTALKAKASQKSKVKRQKSKVFGPKHCALREPAGWTQPIESAELLTFDF
jgi:hypothetical protein